MSDGVFAEYEGASFGEPDGSKRLKAWALPGIAILASSAIFAVWMTGLRPTEVSGLRLTQTVPEPANAFGGLTLSDNAAAVAAASDLVAELPTPPGAVAIEDTFPSTWRLAPDPYGGLAELRPSVSSHTLALRSPLSLDLELAPSQVAVAPPFDAPLPPRRPSSLAATPSPAPPVVASSAPPQPQSAPGFFERLFGGLHPVQGQVVAYAAPETTTISRSAPQSAVLRSAAPWGQPSALARYDRFTAVYDIGAKTVYLPNGTKLEAHSGLGERKDDPKFVSEHARGATPPDVYELSLREGSFHGVQALRLKPVGSGDQFGRTGLLAHPYMLGAEGDSFGCVSFKDYDAFLQAFQAGQVKKLAVVAKLD